MVLRAHVCLLSGCRILVFDSLGLRIIALDWVAVKEIKLP